MPSQRVELANSEIYHVVLRAVGNDIIFKDQNDYYRGIFSLYEFNNDKPVRIWLRRQERKKEKLLEKILAGSDPSKFLQGPTLQVVPKRDLFVEILAFCFMPNHIHILVRQLKDGGISSFIQKIGTGYAIFFNKKYERKGHLFNRFKAIHVKTQNQLKNVFVYIHTNPIALIEPGWKDDGVENPKKTIKFLEQEYRWSSYFDYLGRQNFSSITVRDFLLPIMGGDNGCKDEVKNWILFKRNIKEFGNIVLE